MKPKLFIPLIVASLLPSLSFAANEGKAKKRPAGRPDGDAGEVLKPFDKNENHQIDPDELVAMQKAFSALKKLDKNTNGEIEQAEVESPKSRGTTDRHSRAMEGLKKADKNGNQKIDADEIEALQKMLAGGHIMSRLDQNGNGKLEPSEVERLNQRISQGMGRKSGKSSAPSSVRKAPEKPAETPKPEEKKDSPSAPVPDAKPPGNFGN